MKTLHAIMIAGAVALMGLGPAQASCYADYKAKQDDPLRLHYGVIRLSTSSCSSKSTAKREISTKIERDGWKLLTVTGIFDESGLKERESRAGAYYLRY